MYTAASIWHEFDLMLLKAGYKPSESRAPKGAPAGAGGQWMPSGEGWTPQGGPMPSDPNSQAFKDWSAQQIGHYGPAMHSVSDMQQWDNWFRYFSLSNSEQQQMGSAPAAPSGVSKPGKGGKSSSGKGKGSGKSKGSSGKGSGKGKGGSKKKGYGVADIRAAF